MLPVFVAFIAELLGNCTVGTLRFSFLSASTIFSSVRRYLLDTPLSYFSTIVACLGGSTIELHNNSDV